jgi:hypothetical protein
MILVRQPHLGSLAGRMGPDVVDAVLLPIPWLTGTAAGYRRPVCW